MNGGFTHTHTLTHSLTHTHTYVMFLVDCTITLCVFRTAWVQKIKAASEEFFETEKKKREKAYQGLSLHSPSRTDVTNVMISLLIHRVCVFAARSVKASGIGRLLVTILEATELKPAKPNGEQEAVMFEGGPYTSAD